LIRDYDTASNLSSSTGLASPSSPAHPSSSGSIPANDYIGYEVLPLLAAFVSLPPSLPIITLSSLLINSYPPSYTIKKEQDEENENDVPLESVRLFVKSFGEGVKEMFEEVT
jgi:hypothetical protein